MGDRHASRVPATAPRPLDSFVIDANPRIEKNATDCGHGSPSTVQRVEQTGMLKMRSRHTRPKKPVLLLAVVASFFAVSQAQADPLYRYLNFGSAVPQGINSVGDVVLQGPGNYTGVYLPTPQRGADHPRQERTESRDPLRIHPMVPIGSSAPISIVKRAPPRASCSLVSPHRKRTKPYPSLFCST